MNDMPNPVPFARAMSDAVEAMIQERVDASLAAEKDTRLAERAKIEGDAHQRGYQQALTDLEAEWWAVMARLWQGRPAASQGLVQGDPGSGEILRRLGLGVVQFKPSPADFDWMGRHGEQTVTPNLYGWPSLVLDIIRRQWPRYVTEAEIQAQIEAIYKGTVPVWKIRAQAGAMKLPRAPMARMVTGARLVGVNWHQAAMLARGYTIEPFAGDMIALNRHRREDNRLPCALTQPDGPTADDLARFGEPTL